MTENEKELVEKYLKVSLKEYIDLRFSIAEKEAIEFKLTSYQAVLEAKELMKERLQNMDKHIDEVCADVDNLKGLSKAVEGKASQNAYLFSLLLTIIALAMAVLNYVKK